jgi:hypothetical protein
MYNGIGPNPGHGIAFYIPQVVYHLVTYFKQEKKDSRKDYGRPGNTRRKTVRLVSPAHCGQWVSEYGNQKSSRRSVVLPKIELLQPTPSRQKWPVVKSPQQVARNSQTGYEWVQEMNNYKGDEQERKNYA